MWWMVWASGAMAGEVWLDFENKTHGGEIHLHLPATFERAHSTVTTRSGEEVDLAEVAAGLASGKVGKKEKFKLQAPDGVRQKLVLRLEESEGAPATVLHVTGERGGEPQDRTIDLSGDRMDLARLMGREREEGDGGGGGGGRGGGGRGLERMESRLPWDFQIDERKALAVIRAWQPTVLVEMESDRMELHLASE